MENLVSNLNLDEWPNDMKGVVVMDMLYKGFDLTAVDPQMKFWAKSIDIHLMSIDTSQSLPLIPKSMYRDIAEYLDIVYPTHPVPLKSVVFYNICTRLLQYAKTTLEDQVESKMLQEEGLTEVNDLIKSILTKIRPFNNDNLNLN